MNLRPYQASGLDQIREQLRQHQSVLYAMPCGSGKGTVITFMVNTAVSRGKRVIFAVHGKALVHDMSQRVARLGITHGVLMGSHRRERWHAVQVASIDTLHRMEFPPAADLIIADECFIQGTLVTMADDTVFPIETINPGDIVRNATGVGAVLGVSRTVTYKPIVRVKLSNGNSLECTADHRLFTSSGWVSASALGNHTLYPVQAVRALWDTHESAPPLVREEVEHAEILREILLEEGGESDVETWGEGQDAIDLAENWASTVSPWRKREGNWSPIGSRAGSGAGVGAGVADPHAQEERERISDELQGRSRQSVNEGSDRARREYALRERANQGRQEGSLVGGVGVESISSIKRRCAVAVYNLHVSGHPSYFANGVLAHNCHMSLSETWRKTIARYPSAKLVGTTATPCRLDGQGLGRASGGLFDAMVLGPSENELIDMGYLVRSRVLAPPPPADLGTVKKTAGEFNAKAQAVVCDKAKVIGDIVQHWRKHAEHRAGATAAFGVDQAHALHIAEQFRGAGFEFAYVDAETSDQDRDRIWRDLDNRRIRGVSSVGCLSVGWDHSVVDCLIAARKTASLGLWRQILGRGSRIHPGKTEFLVLDHVGNSHLHAPYGLFEMSPEWSLDGEAVRRGDGEAALSVTTCKTPVQRCPCPGAHDARGTHLPCYATFKTGPERCPYCGLRLVVTARKIEVQDGELAEFQAHERKVTPEGMRKVFDNLLAKQFEKGYKENYAAAAFKGMFGHWPPKEWKCARRVERMVGA